MSSPRALLGQVQLHRRWAWGAALVGLLAAFLTLLLLIEVSRTPYFEVDLALERAVQSARSPTVDRLAEAVSWPGYPPQSNVLFGAIIAAILAGTRRLWAAAMELFAAAGSAGLWFAIAPWVDRPRPSPDLVYVAFPISYGSFPSGHVLNFTAGLGFAVFLLLGSGRRAWWRVLVAGLVATYLLLLGLSRIYAGQHWPTDVLGGYLLGTLWLALSVGLYAGGRASVGRLRAVGRSRGVLARGREAGA